MPAPAPRAHTRILRGVLAELAGTTGGSQASNCSSFSMLSNAENFLADINPCRHAREPGTQTFRHGASALPRKPYVKVTATWGVVLFSALPVLLPAPAPAPTLLSGPAAALAPWALPPFPPFGTSFSPAKGGWKRGVSLKRTFWLEARNCCHLTCCNFLLRL